MTITDVPAQTRRAARIHIATRIPAPQIIEGTWHVDRDPTEGVSLPIVVTHIPTGWTGEWPTRAGFLRWAARPLAEKLAELKSTSQHALIRFGTVIDERRRAKLVLAVLGGLVAPHGGDVAPESKCAGCGSYITELAGGVWQHVNACRYCHAAGGWTSQPGVYRRVITAGVEVEQIGWGTEVRHAEWAGVCPDSYREHTMCLTPRPVDCEGTPFCAGNAGVSGRCVDCEE